MNNGKHNGGVEPVENVINRLRKGFDALEKQISYPKSKPNPDDYIKLPYPARLSKMIYFPFTLTEILYCIPIVTFWGLVFTFVFREILV